MRQNRKRDAHEMRIACRRHSNAGVRLWLCERLVSVGMQGFGGMLLGSWGAAVFYRLFGASVGRWATFRMSNVLHLPDMLSIGDWYDQSSQKLVNTGSDSVLCESCMTHT